MTYQCEIQEFPARPTLSIRTRTNIEGLPEVISTSFAAIGKAMGQNGERPAGPPFAAYYNMDMQDLDVELGFPVSRSLPGAGDIQASEIPAGKFAACVHIGPYNEIEPAYQALSTWIEEQGYKTSGVAYEFYLNDPAEIPPEALQTQIAFPLEERS
jgi:effector-binding domain-containing protein